MAGLGAPTEPRLFGLDKIADAIVACEFGAGAQIGERPDFRFLADDAIFGAHAQLQMASGADRHVAQPRGAVDSHALAELACAENLDVGTDYAIGRDRSLLRDVGARRIDQRHPRRHQLAVNGRTNFRFHIRQLLARVYSGEFRRIFRHPRFDFFAARPRNRDDIGQVILTLCVSRLQLLERGPQERSIDQVTSRIDFLDGALGGRGVAVFNNFFYFGARVANHAAIRGRIVEHDADERELCAALMMCLEKRAQGRRGDRWHVAVCDEHVAIEIFRNFIQAKSNSVARAALRLLQREAYAIDIHRGLDFASLVTDDDHNGIGIRFEYADRANRAPNHRLPPP